MKILKQMTCKLLNNLLVNVAPFIMQENSISFNNH
jgi:hypothetical protein